MRLTLLSITLALLAVLAAREKVFETPLSAPPPPPVAQAPAVEQTAATETADAAAAEVTEPEVAVDPCDLSGYDMTKMTVDLHEELAKACMRSRQ